MKISSVFCLLLLFACTSINLTTSKVSSSVTTPNRNTIQTVPNSTFGKYFTPRGDLRALVIYVNYENEFLDPNHHDDLPHWPITEEFPVHYGKSVIDENQNLRWGFQKKEEFKTIDVKRMASFENLSAYYYTMSSGKFRMYFETLKHPETQKAISIRIDPTEIPSSTAGRNELNKRVFQKIREIYPEDYDWSRFDNLTNSPNYKQDASVEGTSANYKDHYLDFVILLFRNSNTWSPHPNGSPNGVAWRKAIMGTGASKEIIGVHNQQPIYAGNEGLRTFITQRNLFQNHELLIHEIAHGMISMPHINRANRAEGDYLFYPYGWGMMDSYSNLFGTANAWERWYAGWTEITHNIGPSSSKKTKFILNDFLKTGESARIQLPRQTDEFVWLEHRKDTSNVYYQRPLRTKDRHGKPHPKHRPGLYAFVEKMAPSRHATFSTNTKGTNGMKVIYGKGNFDYVVEGFQQRYYAWDNEVLQVKNKGANAYGGQHEAMLFRADFNKNGTIERKTNSNGAGSQYIDGRDIFEIDGEISYGSYMFNTPLELTKMSAFTNPAITNFQPMNWNTNTLAPVILHSLSITQRRLSNGNLHIEVDYEDGKIEENFRMAGPIVLPLGESITLTKGKTLLLNKSKTINRIEEVDGSFTANSYLHVEGELILEKNAKLIVDEGSLLHFKANSKLVMKAGSKIEVKNEASLLFDEATQVKKHSTAEIDTSL